MFKKLSGVYAAALTPLNSDCSLALRDIIPFLDFLANRGCHGALLFGTTGEGPSFSLSERLTLIQEAVKFKQIHPDFRLLVGTGTPSLSETIDMSKAALDLNIDGVLVLPPYYYKSPYEEGIFQWYSQVIKEAVADGDALLGYNIPSMTGINLNIDLLIRLKDTFPNRFAGIKDSSGDIDYAQRLGSTFQDELVVLNGKDRMLSFALDNYASGSITALANICSIDSRHVWDAHQKGEKDEAAQARLAINRSVLDRYPPAPPVLKAVVNKRYGLPRWALKPPLLPLSKETEEQALQDFASVE
jgi:4-hydroxy-tetrahydrodipicolinate synthase